MPTLSCRSKLGQQIDLLCQVHTIPKLVNRWNPSYSKSYKCFLGKHIRERSTGALGQPLGSFRFLVLLIFVYMLSCVQVAFGSFGDTVSKDSDPQLSPSSTSESSKCLKSRRPAFGQPIATNVRHHRRNQARRQLPPAPRFGVHCDDRSSLASQLVP